MARDESKPQRDPEQRGSGGAGKRDGTRHAPAAAATRRGKSGYGMESIRPHLRAQLEQRKMWRQEFPPQSEDDDD
jgi:hypothetical protein